MRPQQSSSCFNKKMFFLFKNRQGGLPVHRLQHKNLGSTLWGNAMVQKHGSMTDPYRFSSFFHKFCKSPDIGKVTTLCTDSNAKILYPPLCGTAMVQKHGGSSYPLHFFSQTPLKSAEIRKVTSLCTDSNVIILPRFITSWLCSSTTTWICDTDPYRFTYLFHKLHLDQQE